MDDRTRSVTALAFDPRSPEFIRDPYPVYDELRRTGPMHRLPNGYLLASRAQDIGVILSDKRFGKDFVGRITRLLGADLLEQPAYRTMANFMVSKDPPDHSRLRGLVLKAFSPRQLQELRPRIHENVNRLLDNIEAKGAFDLVADFAYAL